VQWVPEPDQVIDMTFAKQNAAATSCVSKNIVMVGGFQEVEVGFVG
jgi:hypothetical protein